MKKFPFVKIINSLPEQNSLYETVLVSANDELVKQFLEKKIKFTELIIIIITLLIISIGFGKALIKSKETHGKYFSFLAFFFGVPMGAKKTGKIEKCDQKMLKKMLPELW